MDRRPQEQPAVSARVSVRREDLPGVGGLSSAAVRADAVALLRAAALHDVELSVLLCSDARIAELNGAWRDKPVPTDVLSFPQDDAVVLGDLVLSLDTAARQAAERGHGLRDEVRVLLVHGLLHLLGYDHETDDAALAEMAEAEGRLLGQLRWTGEGLIAAAGVAATAPSP